MVTASYNDYAMPRADDLPSFKVGMTTTVNPSNPLGVKGCGEAGVSGSLGAVMGAVNDALTRAGAPTVEMPATVLLSTWGQGV